MRSIRTLYTALMVLLAKATDGELAQRERLLRVRRQLGIATGVPAQFLHILQPPFLPK